MIERQPTLGMHPNITAIIDESGHDGKWSRYLDMTTPSPQPWELVKP